VNTEPYAGGCAPAPAGMAAHQAAHLGQSFARTRSLLDELKLHTVCESAKCPNHWECWSKGTATFMIAGDRCTRACGFCAVSTAKPLALEADEPAMRVAEATRRMKLKARRHHRRGAR
jgi:lipoate synthase